MGVGCVGDCNGAPEKKGENMIQPTKKQRELLTFIDNFTKGNGYSPSFREIMRALEYRSVSTVATHVNGLIARGYLIKREHSARSLEVVFPGTTQPSTHDATAQYTHTKDQKQAERAIQYRIKQLEEVSTPESMQQVEVLQQALAIICDKHK